MYTTTEITVCPFSNKHCAALMPPNIKSQALECLMATRVGSEGRENTANHSHWSNQVARLRHILLHTSVPFHSQQISRNREERCHTSVPLLTSFAHSERNHSFGRTAPHSVASPWRGTSWL
ncbi:hypothetical protein TNCV_2174011 [Trichonephila clavipes]|nr:hypothetical protein TNCV_2174011 [Trichonephila clavipes]